MAELSELLAKLDADSQVRGCQFEHICKWYLENDPKYRLELKKVWLWNDWPGRWGPDAGIDLVAKTYDNKLWAIQAKAYDEKYSIKKADIDTFLSESSRQVFFYRLLITTTNFIGRTAERTLHDQEKPVGRVLLSDLEKSQLEWPDSPEKLEAKPLKRKKPQPHQHKAISDVLKGFSNNERGQLIMACGTGKTLVALWVAEKLQSQRTLILLPSLSLLAQTLREWTINSSERFHYLPVCSDDTVRGADHFVSRTSDLGLPVTTHSDEVAAFLRKRGHVVVFSTYQSSPVIAEAFTREHVPAFDLVIADEAHRCAGHGSGPFATILDETAVKAKRRLFMTATPRYFTDHVRKEAKVVDFEIASMDDENKFGPLFHQLSFSEAIRQDLLSDYQVVIVGVDDPTYHRYAEQGTFVTTDGKEVTDARTLASQIALAKAIRKYKLRRVVSFHGRIKRAKEFSEQLPNVIDWIPEDSRPIGDLWSKHVSGEMPSGRRDALLNRFRHLEVGERGLLANARCLGEGIDLPTLDGVAFIDPRSSQIDIVQAVGRAIRKATDKKIATVVLPVFIDSDQDCEAALESSVFKPVWNVLKALRAHDDVLAEMLDQLRRQLGRYESKRFALPQKLFIDLPVTVGKAFAESFRLKLVERTTSKWQIWFGLLEQHVEREGHARVSSTYVTEDSLNLGAWVVCQRTIYRQGKLSTERQQALEQLPGWVWDSQEASWNEGIEHLREYAKCEGHTRVHYQYVTEDGFKLREWVGAQRNTYRNGKLTVERQKALEKLPGWVWGCPRDELWTQRKAQREGRWLESLKCLREYIERKGDALVPERYITRDGFNLGTWVMVQRAAYRQGKLSTERQKTLEKLPHWVWDPEAVRWSRGFKCLCQYIERKGDALVPERYITRDGFNLGAWVSSQWVAYLQGKLSTERQKALEKLPGWVWIPLDKREACWHESLKRLREYIEREGNALVAVAYVTEDGHKLGSWVHRQRTTYRQGKLSTERQKALEKLPGWVWERPREEFRTQQEGRWLESLKCLREYIERKGDALVPEGYITRDGFSLGAWVSAQQNAYLQGKLSIERQKAFEKLQHWVWDTEAVRWFRDFKCLCEYMQANGDARVHKLYFTKDGFHLGKWIKDQRTAYRQGKLSTERQKALEKLPRWVLDERDAYWHENLKRLREYIEREGNARVPQRYATKDGHKLGSWVYRQRAVHRRGKLSTERQKALEKVPGWVWIPLDKRDARWHESLKRLREYIEREGHARVAGTYVTEDGHKLGSWVDRQQVAYRQGKLSTERQKALEKLPGWVWGRPRDELRTQREGLWLESLKCLREYIEREGDALVPERYITRDGFSLGNWVMVQRVLYQQGKLSRDRQKALEQLPRWVWNPQKTPAKTKG